MAIRVGINWVCLSIALLFTCTVLDVHVVALEDLCGRPSESVSKLPRIVGGKETTTKAFPWTVFIGQYGNNGVVCGGAILAENLVLTAAHCFNHVDVANLYMWVGLDVVDGFSLHQRFIPVNRVIKHERYDPKTNRNDIALIVTGSRIPSSDYIQPVCLSNNTYHLPEGHKCLIAGYGDTQGTGTERRLNYATVPLVDSDTCAQDDWLGHDFSLVRTVSFCAGYADGGPDACSGDSGSALVCRESTSDPFVVYGISSWGKGCGEVRKPGVYTSIPNFVDWIKTEYRKLVEGHVVG